MKSSSLVKFLDSLICAEPKKENNGANSLMGIEIPKEYMCITMDEDGCAYAHKVESFVNKWFNGWYRTQARGWLRVPELDWYFKGDWKDSMIFFGA